MAIRVLVLGGGFAGLSAARELAKHRGKGADVEVVLIDRRGDSVFSPLLPDLISRRVRPDHVLFPLGPFCTRLGVDFVQADILRINAGERRVETTEGTYGGDAIVICLGCETNYYGNESAESSAPGLKTVEEAHGIRASTLGAMEATASGQDRRPVHLLVVGGGYTGFEIATHLSLLLRDVRESLGVVRRERVRLMILEASDEVLWGCSPRVRSKALQMAGRFGVEVFKNLTVEEFLEDRTVRLTDGRTIENTRVVWAAGVRPGPVCDTLDVPRREGGRVSVDEHLRVIGHAGVFAAGDVAGAAPGGTERSLRMSVQFSLAGGVCAARNALLSAQGRQCVAFSPLDPGYVVPLARGQATGIVLGKEVSGFVPYALHYFMSVVRAWGWRNRWGLIADAVTSTASRV